LGGGTRGRIGAGAVDARGDALRVGEVGEGNAIKKNITCSSIGKCGAGFEFSSMDYQRGKYLISIRAGFISPEQNSFRKTLLIL